MRDEHAGLVRPGFGAPAPVSSALAGAHVLLLTGGKPARLRKQAHIDAPLKFALIGARVTVNKAPRGRAKRPRAAGECQSAQSAPAQGCPAPDAGAAAWLMHCDEVAIKGGRLAAVRGQYLAVTPAPCTDRAG